MIGFNGTGLMLQPTTAGWSPQDSLGVNGFGQKIYPSLQEFQMAFNLTSQGEWFELLTYFNMISTTGSITATLPDPKSNTFSYRDFSGCILYKPEMSEYFAEEYSQEVKVTVLVRT
jgi:hypothetical protein